MRSMQACHALCSPVPARVQQRTHSTAAGAVAFSSSCPAKPSSSSQLNNLLHSRSSGKRACATVAARAATAEMASDVAGQEQQRLPVTVISGFLGEQR
jgi:hypothetical protein